MQRNTGYFPTESLEPSGNRLFSRSALNEGDLFRGSLIVIYYLTGGNNSMSRFCKFGKLHVTKGNVDKLLGILLTASKELKRSGPH